jgi:hypothetical protein
MPRILIDGCDTTRIIEQISIDVKVKFSSDLFRNYPERCNEKMKQLEFELGQVMEKYFGDYSSERMSNHEYNTRMNNY